MAAILMICPTTGASVFTGQHTSTGDRDILDRGGRFRCSACKRIHDWTRADVTVVEAAGATSTR